MSMAIITMAPCSLIMRYSILMYTQLYAHAALLQTLTSSPQPIREWCLQSLLKDWIGGVALGVCEWGIDGTPQGGAGTARLLLNPELLFQPNIFHSCQFCCLWSHNMHFLQLASLLPLYASPNDPCGLVIHMKFKALSQLFWAYSLDQPPICHGATIRMNNHSHSYLHLWSI